MRFFNDAIVSKALEIKEVRDVLEKFGLEVYTGEDLLTKLKESPDVLTHITKICSKGIGIIYKIENISDGIQDIRKKDVLVLAKKTKSSSSKSFAASLKAVLVSQIGECAMKSHTVSLNLICSKQEKGLPLGSILLALFIIIGKLKREKELILEVALGYDNLNAMCLYNKFGFQEDLELFDPERCFVDSNNVPMTLDLTTIKLQSILDLLSRKITKSEYLNALCNLWYELGINENKGKKRKLATQIKSKKKGFEKTAESKTKTTTTQTISRRTSPRRKSSKIN